MAIDYNRMRSMAVRLISENGRAVTVREKVPSNFDPVEGTIDIAASDVEAFAAFVSINESNKINSIIQDGDQLLFCTQEVDKDDLIIDSIDGTQWQVVFVDIKFPGPQKLVWKAQVRS